MIYPHLFQNILSTNDLKYITKYIDHNTIDFGILKTEEYWAGRTLYLDSILDNRVKSLIIENTKHGISILSQYVQKNLYCEHLSIARWPKGYDLQPHADAENPPGCPDHPYPWRDFAMITFLNNNFDGGILYFPNQKIEIIPKPGYTIVFPGTLDYLHGVTQITNGNRYTIACFITYNCEKKNIDLS